MLRSRSWIEWEGARRTKRWTREDIAGEGKSMDMFTREGNIPYTNRNEKPTAATKQPPAASPRERCMYIRMERDGERWRRRRREQEGKCTERERNSEEGGNHGSEDRTESRKVGETVLNHFTLYLSKFCFYHHDQFLLLMIYWIDVAINQFGKFYTVWNLILESNYFNLVYYS